MVVAQVEQASAFKPKAQESTGLFDAEAFAE